MKKLFCILLVFGMLFCLVGCSEEQKFADFQGTWVRVIDTSPYIEETIRINGATVFYEFNSDYVDGEERMMGYELIKEDGKYYIKFSDGKREISVSKDGKTLTYDGDKYKKK
ncbi:MAG: hypothetical protein IJE02_08175 [Clostridia bacterium]|nr:hypothetical protein [Clostridia bacterium]